MCENLHLDIFICHLFPYFLFLKLHALINFLISESTSNHLEAFASKCSSTHPQKALADLGNKHVRKGDILCYFCADIPCLSQDKHFTVSLIVKEECVYQILLGNDWLLREILGIEPLARYKYSMFWAAHPCSDYISLKNICLYPVILVEVF